MMEIIEYFKKWNAKRAEEKKYFADMEWCIAHCGMRSPTSEFHVEGCPFHERFVTEEEKI